jgi:hypothetical protein
MTRIIWHFLIVYLLSSHLAPVMASVVDQGSILQKKCSNNNSSELGTFLGAKADSILPESLVRSAFTLPSINGKLATFELLIPKNDFSKLSLKVGESYQLSFYKDVLCTIEVQANGEGTLKEIF